MAKLLPGTGTFKVTLPIHEVRKLKWTKDTVVEVTRVGKHLVIKEIIK